MSETSKSQTIRVLFVEDSEDDVLLSARVLRDFGLEPEFKRVDRAADFAALLDDPQWDVVLCDYSMPGFSGHEALQIRGRLRPRIPFIFLSATMGEDKAVRALQEGADDYVVKADARRLGPAVKRALKAAAQAQERDKLEDQLRQAQKMEVVGQLASGIAHDFNNLLLAIVGNMELLQAEVDERSGHRRLVDDSLEAGRRGTQLIQRLLAFSRRQVLQPAAVDLNGVVADAMRLLRRTLGAHVRIQVRCDPGLWMCVLDRSQAESAIANLAVNARDAMSEGGQLTVSTRNVAISESNRESADLLHGDYVCISVSDTGTGMDSQTVKSVFEPFFTTKPPGEGTGLGLSMVYGFVRQSGGDVTIESELGKGTTVHLYFPRERGEIRSEGNEQSPRTESVPSGRPARVLVVDDEPLIRDLTVRMLRSLDHDVVVAEDARHALQMLGQDPLIDLLLTDLNMKNDMPGTELALRAVEMRPALRVVVVSGNPDMAPEIERERLFQCGRFLAKPWTRHGLSQAISELLEGRE